jgi:hypothetical protein
MAHAARTTPPRCRFARRASHVDAAGVLERLRRLRAEIAPHDSAARLRDAGVDVFFGEGRFVSPDAISVRRRDAQVRARGHRDRRAPGACRPSRASPTSARAPATPSGSSPAPPSGSSSWAAAPSAASWPRPFNASGSAVTLIEREARILGKRPPRRRRARGPSASEPTACASWLATTPSRRRASGAELTVRVRAADGAEHDVVGDELLVAAGRRVSLDALDLDAAGIARTKHGLSVDQHLRTTNRRVFVAGDAAGSFQFTHAADAHARMVLRNAFFFGRGRVGDLVIPWATYTEPEVAHVGVDHATAEREGLARFRVDFDHVDRALLEGDAEGFAELVRRREGARRRRDGRPPKGRRAHRRDHPGRQREAHRGAALGHGPPVPDPDRGVAKARRRAAAHARQTVGREALRALVWATPVRRGVTSPPPPCPLVVMAKAPEPGRVKTRLARAIGADAAAAIARASLCDVWAGVHRVAGVAPTLALAGDPARLPPLFPSPRLVAQGDGDLGQRMVTPPQRSRSSGHGRALMVGSDSPGVPTGTPGARPGAPRHPRRRLGPGRSTAASGSSACKPRARRPPRRPALERPLHPPSHP